jgi:hypothetical protein
MRSQQGHELLRCAASLGQLSSVRLHGLLLLEPLKNLLQYPRRAFIGWHHDAVVHPLAIAPGRHDASIPQICQMPGYLRLWLIQNLYEIADAYFLIAIKFRSRSRVLSPSA